MSQLLVGVAAVVVVVVVVVVPALAVAPCCCSVAHFERWEASGSNLSRSDQTAAYSS